METKRCCLCEENKPISEFYNRKRSKDGKQSRCKACQFVFSSRKELKIVAGQRAGHLTAVMPVDQRNRDREKQWVFRCDCGREIIRSVTKVLNGHRISCGCKTARFATKKDSNFTVAYHEYKRGAKLRNHSWELSRDLVRVLFTGDCFYCGAPPSIVVNSCTGDVLVRNGIDRLDSSIGYTSGNCVSCCARCNYAKGNMAYQEFIDFIKAVYEKLAKK